MQETFYIKLGRGYMLILEDASKDMRMILIDFKII